MKLFGKELFKSKKGLLLHEGALDEIKRSEFLVDFYRDLGEQSSAYISISDPVSGQLVRVSPAPKQITKQKETETKKIAPKEVYELKMLNNLGFQIKTDPEYIDKQIEDFKERLNMLNTQDYDMRRGLKEIASILTRFENRKKYKQYAEFFEQYPYTMSGKIDDLVKANDHLKLGQVAQFLADLPKEAVDTMKQYTKNTQSICEKKPVFYIIAEKKDFEKTNKRRDPILLAQSPFGHFWQILGAWDKEMLLVDEL